MRTSERLTCSGNIDVLRWQNFENIGLAFLLEKKRKQYSAEHIPPTRPLDVAKLLLLDERRVTHAVWRCPHLTATLILILFLPIA